MNKTWAGVTAGLLAGAAGATAKSTVSYLDQSVTGDAPPSSPAAPTVRDAADTATVVATQHEDGKRAQALGPLGGIAVGLGVGAVSGIVRGRNGTPNPVVAAALTGVAAMAVTEGVAAATGNGGSLAKPTNLARDLLSHLAFGAVTA